MLDNYQVDVVWGPRKETRDECLARAVRCLKKLGQIDPSMASWSIKGPGQEPHSLTPAALNKIVRPGTDFEGEGRNATCRLGFNLEIHAGTGRHDWIDFSARCGEYSDIAPNLVKVAVPGPETVSGQRLFQPGVLEGILAALVACYEPSWGIVNPPNDYGAGFEGLKIDCPSVAWMTYLSAARGPLPPLSHHYRVVAVKGHGTIIVTVEEPYSSQNERHLRLAQELYDLLNGHGLMGPP